MEYNTDLQSEIDALEEPTATYNPYICSPLNYIGGKYKILPQILPNFPENIGTFVDLFCGGCNVGINVNADKIVFNDNLLYLIDLYKSFHESTTEKVIDYVEQRIDEYQLSLTNDQGYCALRKQYNKQRNPLDLFVLVAYSFNHQIRFNNSHEFNNPFGKERSCYNQRMKSNLVLFLNNLYKKNTSFVCNNFDDFDFNSLGPNDFVYCDPPYLISTGTYNDGKRGFTGWSEKEETKLLNILCDLNARNIRFALSNVLTHKEKENSILIDWANNNNFNIIHLDNNYSNSNYHTTNRDKNGSDEVLITNYLPIVQQMALEFI